MPRQFARQVIERAAWRGSAVLHTGQDDSLRPDEKRHGGRQRPRRLTRLFPTDDDDAGRSSQRRRRNDEWPTAGQQELPDQGATPVIGVVRPTDDDEIVMAGAKSDTADRIVGFLKPASGDLALLAAGIPDRYGVVVAEFLIMPQRRC
jgi:hypothetical protein